MSHDEHDGAHGHSEKYSKHTALWLIMTILAVSVSVPTLIIVLNLPHAERPPPAPIGGGEHTFSLAFTESSDLRTLGFNTPKGQSGSDPVIEVKAGDSVTINLVNNGKMPHAFGIVSDPDNPNTVVFDAKFKSPDNPILHGETGTVKFVAVTPGHYYYICTVLGHAALGMQGDFIVEK